MPLAVDFPLIPEYPRVYESIPSTEVALWSVREYSGVLFKWCISDTDVYCILSGWIKVLYWTDLCAVWSYSSAIWP